MHVLYEQDGKICQCSNTATVPKGVKYWIAQPGEVPEDTDRRDWAWKPSRPADGVGQ